MNRQEEILRVLAPGLRTVLRPLASQWDKIEEIRLRTGQPLTVKTGGRSVFVSQCGNVCDGPCDNGELHRVTMEEIRDTMNLLSSFSRYAFEEKIRQGFLTIQGGHRVGLAGRVIMDQTKIKTISPITCLNIRIARQVIGCAEEILPWLWQTDEKNCFGRCYDTLVISPPGMGKTTLLRDLIRLFSCQGLTVGVIDERSELAACYQGIPQNDLGPRTDVLDGCPKAEGLMMLMRTMSPEIVAVDEVGTEEDHDALEYAMHCGSRILATAHGSSWEEVCRRPILERWLHEGRFGRYVFIEKDVTASYGRYRVYDSDGKIITSVSGKR